ncbi:MAG TPA: PIN domain-containing protein [Thermoprotei archaeon]|nr:PIN domain-containing protein [Thermoprotei archaeon]
MIVVDASALTAFILREDGWRDIAEYLVRAVSIDHLLKEVSNAIWKAYYREYISFDDALKAYNILKSMIGRNITLYPEIEYIDDALKIALENRLTVYDSLYIVLARSMGGTLLTLDDEQAKVATKLGIKVHP